jgi:LuxR family maltose regulon positive regulatory protein
MDFMNKTKYITYKFMQEPALRITGALPVGRAELLYESGNIDEALPYLSQGLDESGLHGIAHVYLPGMLCLADIQKAGGDFDGAYRTVEECQAKLKALDEISACKVADAFKAQLDLEFNLMDSVTCWEKNARISPFDNIVSFHPIYLYFTLVRVLTKTGRRTLAHLLLNKIKKLVETFPVPNYYMFVYFLDAHLALCEDRTQEARFWLLQLLRTGYTYGYVRFFADRGQDMKDLLEFGIRENICEMPGSVPLEYMQRLLAMTDEYIEKTNGYRKAHNNTDASGVTPREREILTCMARNLTNQEIADRLYVSLQTVKNHTSSIYRKLNVVSRMQAVSAARAMGIISY